MRKAAMIMMVFFLYCNNAHGFMKKIQLKEGVTRNIHYADLDVSTLLQIYDEKSVSHLIGDVYLRIEDGKGKFIADFYVDRNEKRKEYYTKIYKNYFVTFINEKGNRHLVLEQAQLGKVFALSSNGSSAIGNKDDLIELEITDCVHEWSYDAPPEDDNRSYFSDVNYTLKVKVKDVIKSFNFNSSEIKGNYTIDLGSHSISILSDLYLDTSCLIEMVINKADK